ncbi:nucleotide exchange factor GrpE [Actinophytocola sp.]|uniref:nucleotide exchange factor GrpE n=1 Tax=Actinophytocola sp. TaxID=1872138 RepID=UPI0039C86BDD
MPSWFKRVRPEDDSAESTIEVKASVIAEAARSGTDGASSVIAADGVIAGADFDAGLTAEAADLADGVDDDVVNQALAERKSLVHLCMYALDRARSSGVAERIEEGLAAVGVTALRPDGQRFDPAQHEAGGTVATEDEALNGVVAETEVVGFADRGHMLRAPVVTVYNRMAP